jgi:hypothetical protein
MLEKPVKVAVEQNANADSSVVITQLSDVRNESGERIGMLNELLQDSRARSDLQTRSDIRVASLGLAKRRSIAFDRQVNHPT